MCIFMKSPMQYLRISGTKLSQILVPPKKIDYLGPFSHSFQAKTQELKCCGKKKKLNLSLILTLFASYHICPILFLSFVCWLFSKSFYKFL